jgi:hypothetical protein
MNLRVANRNVTKILKQSPILKNLRVFYFTYLVLNQKKYSGNKPEKA